MLVLLLGALVFSLGSIALTGYALGSEAAYGWGAPDPHGAAYISGLREFGVVDWLLCLFPLPDGQDVTANACAGAAQSFLCAGQWDRHCARFTGQILSACITAMNAAEATGLGSPLRRKSSSATVGASGASRRPMPEPLFFTLESADNLAPEVST
jgi:hypothetical protein